MKKVKWIKGSDMQRIATFCFVLFFLLFFTGCATITSLIIPNPPREKTAEELATSGMAYLRGGDYYKSAEAFQQIKDRYPFSQYSLLAALKLADIHYHRKEYEEAVSAYQEFEKLHPTNEALPYVTYQIGMSYFRQMLGVDRDQAATRNALNEFHRLLNTYPDSPYVIEAKERIRQCRERLAEHELYVGRFYLRTEQYRAALNRLRRLVSDYPETPAKEKALALIKQCEGKLAAEVS
ncbi:MAG: outer membrane protein assembly factor BamD [Thermodesulfobacteriota bacterium]